MLAKLGLAAKEGSKKITPSPPHPLTPSSLTQGDMTPNGFRAQPRQDPR